LFTLRSSDLSLPFRFPIEEMCAFLNSSMLGSCPTHLIPLYSITLEVCDEAYKLRSSSVFSLLYPNPTSSDLGPNILFSTLFSKVLNLHSSVTMRDQDSHSHKTRKITILFTLLLQFLERRREDTL
jgi:hypothetical protein